LEIPHFIAEKMGNLQCLLKKRQEQAETAQTSGTRRKPRKKMGNL